METTKAGRTVLIIATVLALLTLAACVHRAKEEPPAIGTEIDYLPPQPVIGDIINDVANPKTSARAYEEMQETPYGLRSRVIVEYKGKKTEMQPSSAILEFSPDGRYLLYVARTKLGNEDGTYLYNVETGKTQELAPSVPDTDPHYKPFPDKRYMKWENGKITYTRFGKTWTLTYKEE